MKRQPNYPLLLGAWLSLLAGLLHIAIIIGGAEWYRFFGAGERLSTLAADGSPLPAVLAAGVALILFLWAGYAFAGAGILSPLPFLKPALIIISGIYLARGLVLIPAALFRPESLNGVKIGSSLVCFGMGLSYAIGTWQAKKFPKSPSEILVDPRTMARAKFCKETCPICRYARKKGKGIAFQLVRMEGRLCPFCRAYEQVYRKQAYR
jgi:hypothetical protein